MEQTKTNEQQRLWQVDKRARQRRQWALDHPEQTRSYGRGFYQRNMEKRKASSVAYYREHKAERNAYSREYYRRKKAQDPDYVKKLNQKARENRQETLLPSRPRQSLPRDPWEQKVSNCRKTLEEYAYRSIERVRMQFPEQVAEWLALFPFEEYGHRRICAQLYRCRIFAGHAAYDDCYEAGMLAYLYSMHRCAALNCDYTVPYIRKMVRIYVLCALIVYRDAHNLCRANGFREVQLDADTLGRMY